MKTGLAQINPTVGDFAGNLEKMKRMYAWAKEAKVDLLVCGELCMCGYPPEDLLGKKDFLAENKKAVEQLAKDCPDMTVMAGFAETENGNCYNSLAVIQNGKITKIYRKALLPNYGVFDEKRYFQPGTKPLAVKIKDLSVVCTICEDIWELNLLKKFLADVTEKNLLVNISASPFSAGKIEQKIIGRCGKNRLYR